VIQIKCLRTTDHLFGKSGPDDAENELGNEGVFPQGRRGEGLACGGTQ